MENINITKHIGIVMSDFHIDYVPFFDISNPNFWIGVIVLFIIMPLSK